MIATIRNGLLALAIGLTGLGHGPADAQSRLRILAPQATAEFLDAHDPGSVWRDAEDIAGLQAAISGLEAHGLNPLHYLTRDLLDPDLSPRLRDQLATSAWFSAAAHMLYGKLDPETVEPDWTAANRQADLAAMLKAALATNSVATSLEALAPRQPGYAVLRAEYEALKTRQTEPQAIVSDGPVLKPGMSGVRVHQVEARLRQLGFEPGESGVMDENTLAAVKFFQASVDLDDDGIIGAATLTALNRGDAQKLEQIRVNLERWRWLPDDLGRVHLRANIAGFDVTAYKDGVAERTHLTIVGKTYRKTPVFSDEIEYIVFNPWWETPPSLARQDKLPMFQRDPGAVQRLGFQVLDRNGAVVDASTIDWKAVPAGTMPYRLRQAPGDLNALGQVKIMFPNKHNVYLHDTPTRGLFAQRQRAFSSGCMRTQNPIDLSEWLLSDTPNWDRAKIEAALASKKETRANLAGKIPVHVLYLTAVSETDGGVRYLDDIYGRDAAVLTGLRAPPQ